MILMLKLIVLVVGLALVAILARRARANARRLDEGIEEYRKDQEAQGPHDPFADLIDLMAERSQEKKAPQQ